MDHFRLGLPPQTVHLTSPRNYPLRGRGSSIKGERKGGYLSTCLDVLLLFSLSTTLRMTSNNIDYHPQYKDIDVGDDLVHYARRTLIFFFSHTPGIHRGQRYIMSNACRICCRPDHVHSFLGPIGSTFAKKCVDAGFRVLMCEIGAAYVQ